MVLKIVSTSEECQRRVAISDFGLTVRDFAAQTMLLSAQSGDAFDFHSALSQVVAKIKHWPDGQFLPTTNELRHELNFRDRQPDGDERALSDTTSESLEDISAKALSYVAAIYQGVSPQIWPQKRNMLKACAELVGAEHSGRNSVQASAGKKRRMGLSQSMRSALDYFLSDNPIRRSTKREPKKSTIRALVRRNMLHQTGSGVFDYRTNTAGRIEFVNAPG